MITGMRLWFSWATSATWSTLSRVNDRSPRTRSRKQWKNGQTANTPRSRVNGRLKVRFIQLLRELFCLFFFFWTFYLSYIKHHRKPRQLKNHWKSEHNYSRTHHPSRAVFRLFATWKDIHPAVTASLWHYQSTNSHQHQELNFLWF